MRQSAFTLIELLVVITVIAILAGMTLGGVKVVRESAKSSRCSANLRQYGLAVQLYVNNFEGMLPPAAISGGDQSLYRAYNLPGMLIMNECLDSKIALYSNPPTAAMRTIFDCPAALDQDVSSLATYAFCSTAANATSDICQGFFVSRYGPTQAWVVTTSYTANCVANGSDAGVPFDEMDATDTPPRNTTKAMASLSRPSSLALIWDGAGPLLNGAVARISGRHANRTRTNVLFADGHVGTYATLSELHPQFLARAVKGDVSFFMQ